MAFWTFNGKVFLTCFCQLSMGFNLITKSVETLRLTLRAVHVKVVIAQFKSLN